ncbi:hypothetical protein BDP55DRAFT_118276 [Colletotrichum godetiae]|uniref:Heterokaryon incompatibility domain-containing protein n=1 Tax=Colletotrichum godetiae TaxID=1209918 RepID=A0AAJ0AL99_9PEZI|nr:uncharacterized protein BDP55DRAFT_118276 [Colletotrichum godetiae]KAK1675986.1 hypothetical protein BDP55DRAFT_118276 [Colletotrichum godetiae]
MCPSDSSITAELTQWHEEKNSEKTDNDIRITYIFSPEWEALLHPRWAAYDELEKRRLAEGGPRLEWQDAVDQDRKTYSAMKEFHFKPLESKLWPISPLWVHLARYKGGPEFDAHKRLHGWASLLDDWDEIQQLVRDEAEFCDSISPAQRRSFDLLQSWWKAAYCDEELLRATVARLESNRPFWTISNPSDGYGLRRIAGEVKTDTSLYHSHLFRLFLFEFHPHFWEPFLCHLKLSTLQHARYRSACVATIQKLSYPVLHPGHPPAKEQAPYPIVVQNDAEHQIITSVQASINPYYLWDNEGQQTVTVEGLPECPPYVCISHTWGRWRTRTDTTVPGVPWLVPENTLYDVRDLPGQLKELGYRYIWFDLFCIPQDKSDPRAAQEIANQTSIFKGSSHCIAWINDVESWNGVLAALDWMSLKSQSLLSNRDTDAIKDRISETTQAATVAMELLKRKRREGMEGLVDLADDLTAGEPTFWMSSLWTLQECILCPEIQLYTRTWTRLEDRSGTAISLRTLMVFLRDTRDYNLLPEPIATPFSEPLQYDGKVMNSLERKLLHNSASDRTFPNAVRDLYQLCKMTRLDNALTSGSPTTVLTNANLRHCSSSRAPAIMSAVGVTDWYVEHLKASESTVKPAPPAEPLVYGTYPLAFLRECSRKFGAIFYESMARDLVRSTGTANEMRRVLKRNESGGTMLPVSKTTGWYASISGSSDHTYIDRQDHETVAGWLVNEDASVSMRGVGIALTSDDKPGSRQLSGSIDCFLPRDDEKVKPERYTANVKDVLATLKDLSHGSRRIYAVALYQDLGVLHGVLLEKLPLSMFGKHYLNKIGQFLLKEASLPPPSKVDWKVL